MNDKIQEFINMKEQTIREVKGKENGRNNRLKKWEKDLENSVENYQSTLRYFDGLIEQRLLAPGDIDTKLEIEKRLEETERELSQVQWMIRMEENVEEIKKMMKIKLDYRACVDNRSYW